MAETGSVKFSCEQIATEIGAFSGFGELNAYRKKLLELGMIGVDANGVGFGNLSIREGPTNQFYITGSGTGGIAELTPSHYARVIAYDFAGNWLRCEGITVASSESLTHAAVYESEPSARAVIHCHNVKLWTALLHTVPITPEKVEYGTPEMAYAVRNLFEKTDVRKKKIFAMAGHEGGVVAFEKDLGEAYEVLSRELRAKGKEHRRRSREVGRKGEERNVESLSVGGLKRSTLNVQRRTPNAQ